MTDRLSEMTSLTVARSADHVVLTMTPQRAQLVADSIELGDTDHTLWLDSLADLLRSAAASETTDAIGVECWPARHSCSAGTSTKGRAQPSSLLRRGPG